MMFLVPKIFIKKKPLFETYINFVNSTGTGGYLASGSVENSTLTPSNFAWALNLDANGLIPQGGCPIFDSNALETPLSLSIYMGWNFNSG